MIESVCGARVGLFGLLTAGAKVPREYCATLDEGQGWLVGRVGGAGRLQWVDRASIGRLGGVLWHLKGIFIRGSFFEGEETTQLSRVRVYAQASASNARQSGEQRRRQRSAEPEAPMAYSRIAGCCRGGRLSTQCRPASNLSSLAVYSPHGEYDQFASSLRVAAQQLEVQGSQAHSGANACKLEMEAGPIGSCSSSHAGPEHLEWPVDGSLPCDGELERVPVIQDVFPRFARRRGGTLITVTGENFGLTGTHPIMRVAGSVGACWHRPIDTPAANAPPIDESLPEHCRDGILNGGEDKVDCGGSDCPRCEWIQLPGHCRDGVMSADETGVDMGGRDCLPEHCFSTVAGDETGNNCGGSCQPCSPARVSAGNQHVRLVCEVPPGPLGSRWGIQVATADAAGTVQASCPGPALGTVWGHGNHWRAAGFEFGRLETKWASALLPDGVVTDAEVLSLQVDQATGDAYIAGTVLGALREDTRQAPARRVIPGRTNRYSDGGATEGLGLGVGPADTLKRAGFVGRLSREGRLRWLAAVEPGELTGAGTTGAEASPSSLALIDAADGSVRVVVAGVYEDAVVNLFHADPETGASAGNGGSTGAPVKCENGLGYSAVESMEQGDVLPNGRRRLRCTHIEVPKPPVRTFNAFVAMYNANGLVMWAKGNLAASSNIQSTLEGAARVKIAAGSSGGSVSFGAFHFAVLTGTLQILTNNVEGVFSFGSHPGTWADGGYPLAEDQSETVSVRYGGSALGAPRVGFVAHLHMTDGGAWVEWVRLVGSLGTPFQTDLGMASVATKWKRSGILHSGHPLSEEDSIVVVGNFNAESSSIGTLPIQNCSYLYASGGSLTQRGALCSTSYNAFSTSEPRLPYNGTADGRNAFVVAYSAQGEVRWTRSISGVSQASSVAIFSGFQRAAPTRSHHGATGREYIAARRPTTLGPLEEANFVVVAGNLGKLSQVSTPATASAFGVTRQPRRCSLGRVIGEKYGNVPDSEPCSGVLQSRGEHSDVFVAKYELASGEPQWAKRLGLNDAHEEAFAVAVGSDGGVYVSGAFTAPFVVAPGTAHDVFDMVRAGRPFAVGCGLFNSNTQAITVQLATQLGYWADPGLASTDTMSIPSALNQASLPSCLILPHAPLLQTAFVVKVVDGLQPLNPSQADAEQGLSNGTEWSQLWGAAEHGSCGNAEGVECLADGVTWARSVGVGQGTFSSQSVSALALAAVDGDVAGEQGYDVASGTRGARGRETDGNGVMVGGVFSGFRESQGVSFVVDEGDDGAAAGLGGFFIQDRRDVAGFVVHWRE